MSTHPPTESALRTCSECHGSQPIPADSGHDWPLRCPCGARWCAFCRAATARVRWQSLGMQGTKYHVSLCVPCRDHARIADQPHASPS